MPLTLDDFAAALKPPYLTATLDGLGGTIKSKPEDFEVEEIPAYLPLGQGEFLYLWIEKTGMGASFFQRQIAQRLNISPDEIGSAGLKDRHAVTRQWISLPRHVEDRLTQLEGDGIRVLKIDRHANKLKTGHLHGNRFRILLRDITAPFTQIESLLDELRKRGVPNFYGLQRFGRNAETLKLGLDLLQRDPPPRPSSFLKKLALSAVQSALFNLYLAERMSEGLLHRVLDGDVMCKIPRGGMFVTAEPTVEQARFERREIVTAGPIVGTKTFAASATANERENLLLERFQITARTFAPFSKLMPGTRRHNLIYLDDLIGEVEPEGLRLSFSLPAGSYATIVLREVMKSDAAEQAEES